LPGENRTRGQKATADSAAKILTQGEALIRRAAQVQHNLMLPDRDLLRRFHDAIGIDESLGTLRDLNQAAAEYLRRAKLDEQYDIMQESTRAAVEVQGRLEWLEVFVVGFYVTGVLEMFTRRVPGFDQTWGTPFVLLGGLFSLSLTAWILKPWERPSKPRPGSEKRQIWVLGILIASYIVGLVLWRLFPQAPLR
jgi:hypothetical protein